MNLQVRKPGVRYLAKSTSPFTTAFTTLATAREGIALLKELICSLAISGRLLPQDFSDQSATKILPVLAKEKYALIEAGHIRRERTVDEKSDTDFDLPRGWAAVRLSEVAWPQAGFAFKSSGFNDLGAGLPLIRIRDVGADAPATFFSGEFRDEFIVRAGDWLIGMDGDFRVAIWKGPDALLNQRVTRLVFYGKETQPLYICLALQQELRKLQGTKAYTTVDHLSGGQIASRVILLPPVNEQRRIVARVEELMKLCDALEACGRLADEQHARLTSTLFDALAASESAHALAENWQRIAEHFDILLDRPEAIDALEQTVLRLAMRGLLVPQSATEEPASSFVKRIRDEKLRLSAKTMRGGDKPQVLVSDVERPFAIPSTWEWVRFGELVHVSSGITLGRKSYPINPITLPYLRVANVQRWFLSLDHMKEITVDESELARFLLRSGDLLLTEGGDWDKVGRTCIWNGELGQCLHQNHVFKARGVVPDWSPVWAELFLNSIDARNFFAAASKQTTNLASINSTQLKSCPFPLPPVHEQRRIVARVEELRHLCAQLRERLTSARRTQSQLAEALVDAVANEPNPVTDMPVSIAPHLVRAARNCYAIQMMADEPGFGRTQLTKVDYLLAAHIPASYPTQHTRMPAGPHDEWISSFEKEGEHSGWFSSSESIIAKGNKMVRYTPKPGILNMVAAGTKELGEKRVELDRILTLLKGKKTEEVEMISTLYAVWNDALIAGEQCSDDALINDFFNWHEKKRRFDAKDLKSKLAWMRQNGLVPSGNGTSTSGQNKLFSN